MKLQRDVFPVPDDAFMQYTLPRDSVSPAASITCDEANRSRPASLSNIRGSNPRRVIVSNLVFFKFLGYFNNSGQEAFAVVVSELCIEFGALVGDLELAFESTVYMSLAQEPESGRNVY